jgi:site-specific DNA recombinase
MTRPLVAIYARVSSEQQSTAHTIDSQIAALRERVATDSVSLSEQETFIDNGFSGATLVRPALEQLRDMVAAGGIDRLYVQAPDRLARKYAYQVLLLEEFKRAGVEVIFLNHSVGQTPEDELLVQVQGMVAEYERAKILERGRRGKRHAALAGAVSVLGHVPYGYRYVPKAQGGGQAQCEIVLPEARVVRQIFGWVGRERLSLGEVARRLMQAGILSRTGKSHWDRSIVWTMLKNPAYKGKAAFGKTCMGPGRPRLRAQRGHPLEPRRPQSPYPVPTEQWIEIPIPALVSEEEFAAVQEQLTENQRRAKHSQREQQFLAQGLTVCARCGYAYCGARTSGRDARGQKRSYGYYRCTGADSYRFGGHPLCANAPIRGDLLDSAAWGEVRALLQEPERLLGEYHRRLENPHQQARQADLAWSERQIRQVRQGIGRLIDSYAEGLIEKSEFEPRIRQLKERVAHLETQAQALAQAAAQERELRLVIGQLADFTATVRDRLDHLDWETRQAILRALVKRVEIDHEQIQVVFRVGPGPILPDSHARVSQDCEGRDSGAHAERRSRQYPRRVES